MTSENPYAGGEFDWFLIDVESQLACCSTAGHGEMPAQLYGLVDGDTPLDHIDEIIEALPILGQHESEGRGPGACKDWTNLGDRGLFTFDWKHWSGPYERIIRPTVPLSSNSIPDRVLKWMRPLSTQSIAFTSNTAFQFNDLELTAAF